MVFLKGKTFSFGSCLRTIFFSTFFLRMILCLSLRSEEGLIQKIVNYVSEYICLIYFARPPVIIVSTSCPFLTY